MTAFRDIVLLPGGIAIRILALLLLTMQLYLCIASFRCAPRRGVRSLSLLHAGAGMLVLVLLLDGTFYIKRGLVRTSWPDIVTWVGDAPYLLIVLLLAGSAVIAAVHAVYLRRITRLQVGAGAIKETIDLLPAGICFGTADGTAVMSNVQMNELSVRLTGNMLQDVRRFWQGIEAAGGVMPGPLQGTAEPGTRQVVLPASGESWQFSRSVQTIGDTAVSEIAAIDTTDLYRLSRELEEKNAQLRGIQQRMKIYSAEMDDMVIAQEILNARTAVHDELGHVLLTSKYYLEHPEQVDEASLLHALKETNYFLRREAEEDDAAADPIRDAVRLAEAIGVQVQIPEETDLLPLKIRLLLGAAIRECAANAVKHADGTELYVHLRHAAESGIICELTNNGTVPEKPVVEAGGLLSLRHQIEQAGGQMRVESAPAFKLILQLPVQE